jgi:hypothetical protein
MEHLTPDLFWDMVDSYPLGSSRDFYRSVGGGLARAALGNPAYENTCAARLSDSLTEAFRRHGRPPLSPDPNGGSLPGADGNPRIFRVAAISEALDQRFGAPEVHIIEDQADLDAFVRSIEDRPGIFAVRANFSDSTGHVGLWDGGWCRDTSAPYDCYFGYAHKVSFWPVIEPPSPEETESERKGPFAGFFGRDRGADSSSDRRSPAPSPFFGH